MGTEAQIVTYYLKEILHITIYKNNQLYISKRRKLRFQGVGIALIQVKGTFILLAPAYLSTQDDANVILTSALNQYSKYIKASHEVMEYLSIMTSKKTPYSQKQSLWLA